MNRTVVALLIALATPLAAHAQSLKAGEHTLPPEVAWKNVAVLGDDVLLIGNSKDDDARVALRLDAETGQEVWRSTLELERLAWPLATRDGLIIIAGNQLLGVNPETGKERFQHTFGSRHAQLVTHDTDANQAAIRDGATVRWYDTVTGKITREFVIPSEALDAAYYAWWTGSRLAVEGMRDGVRTVVSVDLDSGDVKTILAESGPHDAMLGMIVLGGAFDPVENPMRGDYAITAHSTDEDHWQLESWHTTTGKRAWAWPMPPSPTELSNMEIAEYGSFDHDTSLFVHSIARDGKLQIQAFSLDARKPLWTLPLTSPTPEDLGRIASVRELSGDRVLLNVRSNAIFETWFRDVVVQRDTGEVLWSAAEPLDYPDDTTVSPGGTHLVQIMAPFGPNTRQHDRSKRPQKLVITKLP